MRPHGYARYRLDRCRCYPCAAAVSAYGASRDAAIKAGTWQPYTIPGPARRHIEQLRSIGYGDRTIAALAGVDRKQIRDIRTGYRHDPGRGNPPLTKIRMTTAAAILAIPATADIEDLPDGVLVDAAPTWQLIDDLIGRGWSRTQIAREAGIGRQIQLGRDRVIARNARRVAALHDRATRWGVDLDEVEHLIDTDTPDSVARRLGYSDSRSLTKVLDRHGRGDLARRLHLPRIGRAA